MDFSAEPLNDPTSGESGHIVRELLLGRRRSRVPWVYMVYNRHARNKVRPSLRSGIIRAVSKSTAESSRLCDGRGGGL
jgi:hypothetical protein